MKNIIIAATTAALALTGCTVAGSDAPTGDPDKTISAEPSESGTTGTESSGAESAEDSLDAVSGRPLSEFEGSPTYEWRAAISENPGFLVGEMQAVAPHLDDGDLSDLLDTCRSIERGVTGAALVDESVVRFSVGPDEQVGPDQAEALVGIAQEAVCP